LFDTWFAHAGEPASRIAALAIRQDSSVGFTGYWQMGLIREGNMKAVVGCFITIFLEVVSPAYSATPAALLNKSVQVSVRANATAKDPSGGVRQIAGTIRQTIYISSLGRVFVRQTLDSFFAKNTSDLPIISSAAVAGRRMAIAVPLIRGRASAIIDFDPQYTSCSARGVVATKSITLRGSDSVIYETISPVTFGASSCSIQSGNALGQ
jgi:hypothetical protein